MGFFLPVRILCYDHSQLNCYLFIYLKISFFPPSFFTDQVSKDVCRAQLETENDGTGKGCLFMHACRVGVRMHCMYFLRCNKSGPPPPPPPP